MPFTSTYHVPDLQWDWSTCLLFHGNGGLTPWRSLAWSSVSGMVNGVLGQKDQRIQRDMTWRVMRIQKPATTRAKTTISCG